MEQQLGKLKKMMQHSRDPWMVQFPEFGSRSSDFSLSECGSNSDARKRFVLHFVAQSV